LLAFRFLAALGIGGEWAVGASLLAETWPQRWRPWLAAILQTAVNCGVLLACLFGWLLAATPHRTIFLVGILPALITLWIRKAVPEPEVWEHAQEAAPAHARSFTALFRGQLLRTTLVVTLVCALGLTAHWALMFWHSAHLRSTAATAGWLPADQNRLANQALYLLMFGSILGNFFAGWVARAIGYARAIGVMFALYFVFMLGAYGTIRDPITILKFLPFIGAAQGAFALFTMCLPPLFPTLLRTTGAGFCYNIGRIIAAAGTVIFGLFAQVGAGEGAICDHRLALLYSAWLFIPAALVSWLLLPEPEREIAAS
jgi:MFS family permease